MLIFATISCISVMKAHPRQNVKTAKFSWVYERAQEIFAQVAPKGASLDILAGVHRW